jgi:hypothetical protein
MPSPRDKALDAARNGEPHKAARILRQSALAEQAKPDWQRDAGYTAKAKAYADAFGKLPDDSDAETAREGKFLARQTAHPKLTDVEAAKQADALGRMSGRLGKRYPDVAARIDSAAGSLRAMDFDTAAQHLRDAQRSSNLRTTQFYDRVPDVPAVRKIQSSLAAAQARAEKAAAYSADMKTSGLYQSAIAAANDYRLSAETGRLAVTPAPRGKPGGPGLYGVKGNMHSPYMQNIVKALIRKGMPPGRAYAVAWGSLRKWAAKSKHPEVRAAAAGGLALEKAAEAVGHAHAVTWDDLALVIDLAYNPDQQRAAGGKFGSGGATTPTAAAGEVKTAGPVAPKKPLTAQQQAAQQQQAAKASATAKATAAASVKARAQARKVAAALKQAQKPPKPDAHQLHVLHMQNLQRQAAARMQAKTAAKEAGNDKTPGGPQTRAGLLGQAASDRKQAGVLTAQRKVLQGELASASGTTSSGQSGSTTSAGASTTASTAPAVAATPATPAAASTTPAASTTAASSAASSTPTAAQLTKAIAGLTTQINALLASATAAQAQAAKMSGGAAPPVATAK